MGGCVVGWLSGCVVRWLGMIGVEGASGSAYCDFQCPRDCVLFYVL